MGYGVKNTNEWKVSPEFQPVLFYNWYYIKPFIRILPYIIMEEYRSAIMETFRDQFIAAELLSYNEVLFEEATEVCYAQPVAVLRGGGGQGAMALGLARFMPKKGLALFMPKKGLALLPPPTPQCICQNVQKYSVRCLKVVPGVPKIVLIRSKSKKYPPISSKAACKICPKVIPDGPKMA